MTSFTETEMKKDISLLFAGKNRHEVIEIPLQKMFDELLTFISQTEIE